MKEYDEFERMKSLGGGIVISVKKRTNLKYKICDGRAKSVYIG